MSRLNVKAFTILELIVTMLITAIVIGITYTAYSIVSRSFLKYQQNDSELATLTKFDMLLKRDFSKSDTIAKTANGFRLMANGKAISYEIDSAYILRISTITDTVKIEIENANMFFEGHPLNGFAATQEIDILDELTFDVLFHNEKIAYHYYKDYSSENLINYNVNAVN